MFWITCLYALVYIVIGVEKIKMLNFGVIEFGSKKWKIEFPKQKCKDLIHEKDTRRKK